MAKIRVTKCERVDNPFYKALVENPFISTHYDFDDEKSANDFINVDIDKYVAQYPKNEIDITRVENPWQVGGMMVDHSRFGGLLILYNKEVL